jgi:hypothetical protein
MPAHPRIDVVAGCFARPAGAKEVVERVGADDDAQFWGHYIVESDGRQMWQADYDTLVDALAGARRAGARKVLLDDGGWLTLLT